MPQNVGAEPVPSPGVGVPSSRGSDFMVLGPTAAVEFLHGKSLLGHGTAVTSSRWQDRSSGIFTK